MRFQAILLIGLVATTSEATNVQADTSIRNDPHFDSIKLGDFGAGPSGLHQTPSQQNLADLHFASQTADNIPRSNKTPRSSNDGERFNLDKKRLETTREEASNTGSLIDEQEEKINLTDDTGYILTKKDHQRSFLGLGGGKKKEPTTTLSITVPTVTPIANRRVSFTGSNSGASQGDDEENPNRETSVGYSPTKAMRKSSSYMQIVGNALQTARSFISLRKISFDLTLTFSSVYFGTRCTTCSFRR